MKYEQFDKPTQVIFWDYDEEKWIAGIAYGSIIICGCCGSVFEIEDVNTCAPDEIVNPIKTLSWVNISGEIAGDEMPEDFFAEPVENSVIEAWYFPNLSDKED